MLDMCLQSYSSKSDYQKWVHVLWINEFTYPCVFTAEENDDDELGSSLNVVITNVFNGLHRAMFSILVIASRNIKGHTHYGHICRTESVRKLLNHLRKTIFFYLISV